MKYIEKEQLIEWLEKEGLYKEVLSEIEKGTFDVKDYALMSQEFVGRELNSIYCNGFFGRTYDLLGAEIMRIYEDYQDGEIVIEVEKNGEMKYGYFDGDWKEWKSVYEHLNEWVNGR